MQYFQRPGIEFSDLWKYPLLSDSAAAFGTILSLTSDAIASCLSFSSFTGSFSTSVLAVEIVVDVPVSEYQHTMMNLPH